MALSNLKLLKYSWRDSKLEINATKKKKRHENVWSATLGLGQCQLLSSRNNDRQQQLCFVHIQDGSTYF
jgi:hypothetical protein